MKKVKIGELKNRLSAFLNLVRKGEEVVVTDRDHPIARMIPFQEKKEKLKITRALHSPSFLKQLSYPPMREPIDSLAALKEEREER
ncbi:MAG: type II toxin-antitoxin system prevent-host-death family antitoxin [Deltaproteobacteria bacterium]|nr:type II toxin-antitoxin system prevent-host-death family antitoxin [Deltaproteobacteria bacterium]